MRKKITLDANTLKLIALCFMTVDHIGSYWYSILPLYFDSIFRTLGRIAAPLYLFVFVQSLRHSRSRLKMTVRLYVAAVIMEIGNRLFGSRMGLEGFGVEGNMFMTFFFLSVSVSCVEALWKSLSERRLADLRTFALCGGILIAFMILGPRHHKYYYTIRAVFFTKPVMVDYAFFIPLGCVMYFAGRKKECLVFGLYSFASFLKLLFSFDIVRHTVFTHFFTIHAQWFMIFSLPFMWRYNGEEGRKHKAFFYLYYPIHQYILNATGLMFVR